jgi:hypothetical protein
MRRFELELFAHDAEPYRTHHFDTLEEAQKTTAGLPATQTWQIRDHRDNDRIVEENT